MGNKYVPVSKADTYALIQSAQNGDEYAKTMLVDQNTGLVKAIAMKFVSSEFEVEDLIQIGYIGLLKAIDKFDVSYDVMFSTYAVPMIMGEIKRFFRDNGRIKVSRTLKYEIYALQEKSETLAKQTGRPPQISDLAKALNMSEEHVLEVMDAQDALFHISSLDEPNSGQEFAVGKSANSPENRIDIMMMRSELHNLSQKERDVIIFRYFRDMTQHEIGKILNISQVQVSRIEKKALVKMRMGMSNLEE